MSFVTRPGILALAALAVAACDTATAEPDGPRFELRRLELGHGSASVLVADPDRDGTPDLIVSGRGRVTVLRGDGRGAFDVGQVVEDVPNPVDLAPGDLDGDGWLDLVVANHDTRHVTLLFGGPEGFDASRGGPLPVDVSPHPHAVAVADVDEDGHLDFLVDDRDRERLAVYRGAGDGTFAPGEPIPVGGDPYRGMTLADVNGDGHVDVVTPVERAVTLRLGDGAGGFTPGPTLDARDVPPFNTAVGDFDGDGTADIAAGSGEGPGGVVVWRGMRGGPFERVASSPYAVAEGPTMTKAADVDGDGFDDLLVTSWVGDELAVLLGGPDGLRLRRIELFDNPWDVAAADLDGDGRTDLVTANDGGPRMALLFGRAAEGGGDTHDSEGEDGGERDAG